VQVKENHAEDAVSFYYRAPGIASRRYSLISASKCISGYRSRVRRFIMRLTAPPFDAVKHLLLCRIEPLRGYRCIHHPVKHGNRKPSHVYIFSGHIPVDLRCCSFSRSRSCSLSTA
jgi:hypothetical protein